MAVGPRSRAELLAVLDDLVTCVRSANERFDQGKFLEARGLAGYVRRLLHQSGESQALIGQLGLEDDLTWVDTAGVPNPKTTSAAACLTLMRIRTGVPGGGSYVPKLAIYPPAPIRTRSGGHIERGSRIPFEHWWTNPVVKDDDGEQYSRKQLVLALAGQNDLESREAFETLADSRSLGWVLSGGAAVARALDASPVIASVRQIGYEVLASIRQQRDIIDAAVDEPIVIHTLSA
ncbi:hypothetical protein JDV09_20270 [Mycobacterium sp. Y57]|uniref:hypothetical protein n=1 Tax=Mycolicibacterium xanthum TaxID=2796469 RepID=UPI001C85CA28|nr:hypothetical protein [Mycolicibacterium xanthum]MBX7434415.1 hypothetical protein [Mycolicibacterium xanthum]